MISKAYEKADFKIIKFAIEDVLTASKVIHTTQPSTTAPPTTIPGTTSAPHNGGDIYIDFDDFFK